MSSAETAPKSAAPKSAAHGAGKAGPSGKANLAAARLPAFVGFFRAGPVIGAGDGSLDELAQQDCCQIIVRKGRVPGVVSAATKILGHCREFRPAAGNVALDFSDLDGAPVGEELGRYSFREIVERDLHTTAVLSGNRNFDGRIHPYARQAFLASPPLVVAYAIAGTIRFDIEQVIDYIYTRRRRREADYAQTDCQEGIQVERMRRDHRQKQ